MRCVVQRVTRAAVFVDGRQVASIGRGLAALVGFHKDDREAQLARLLDKLPALRIFDDAAGKMNRALGDVQGALLLVPQFTLYGDVRGGNRPSFTAAAAPAQGRALFERLCALAGERRVPAAFGVFQTTMQIELVNDGPVTILVEW
ncbi:MAG: D-tyrosyl-tRNA(Tyr) deacylase [Deltaproteobacteria bacterium]|nr:D-tyrosyl-tRNA(Tyr) deacylase [Deltaproteobacteria bacterium]